MTPPPFTDPAELLGVQPTLPSLHFRHMLRRATAESGRSSLSMAWEIVALFLGARRIMAHEYFDYRLYDHATHDQAARDRFIGVIASQTYNRQANGLADGRGIVGQKMMFGGMLRGFGLPTPPLQAVARKIGGTGEIETLRTAEAIRVFLEERARYPMFCKPVLGSLSRGAVSINERDGATGGLRLVGGEMIEPARFAVEIMRRYGDGGYLFEDRLRPHPELADVSGAAIGTVRFVTLMKNGRAHPLYALWKAPSVNAVADTTWRPGNMLALLDPDTGEVLRCQRGAGPDRETPSHHPETGALIVGRRLPDWEAARAVALAASELTPYTRLLGWDLALTDQGPVLVEANGAPNHTLYQLAADKGFLTDAAEAFRRRVATENERRLRKRKAKRRAARRALLRRYFRALRQQFGAPPPP